MAWDHTLQSTGGNANRVLLIGSATLMILGWNNSSVLLLGSACDGMIITQPHSDGCRRFLNGICVIWLYIWICDAVEVVVAFGYWVGNLTWNLSHESQLFDQLHYHGSSTCIMIMKKPRPSKSDYSNLVTIGNWRRWGGIQFLQLASRFIFTRLQRSCGGSCILSLLFSPCLWYQWVTISNEIIILEI